MTKRKADYEVGYEKPPVHTQFQPGQSGNRPGRTPKQKMEPDLPPLDLTRTYIQREGRRMITIREGGEAKSVPVIEAVMHALSIKAMQGSILSQRTLLQHQLAEDARVRAERESTFKIWRDYIRQTEPLFAKAAERGEPPPKIYPHPADMILNYHTLECRIVGPTNAEEASECERRLENVAFLHELMAYRGEAEHGLPSDDNPVVGLFMILYLLEVPLLPPRLRQLSKEAKAAIGRRIMGSRRARDAYLDQRGEELGYPPNCRQRPPAFLDLRDCDLRFVNGRFVRHRWPKRKLRPASLFVRPAAFRPSEFLSQPRRPRSPPLWLR